MKRIGLIRTSFEIILMIIVVILAMEVHQKKNQEPSHIPGTKMWFILCPPMKKWSP